MRCSSCLSRRPRSRGCPRSRTIASRSRGWRRRPPEAWRWPAAVGAAALVATGPAVAAVFGAMRHEDAIAAMGPALAWMAPGLLGYGLLFHVSRTLFALGRGRAAVVGIATGWGVVAVGAVVAGLVLPAGASSVETLEGLGAAISVGMLAGAAVLLGALRQGRRKRRAARPGAYRGGAPGGRRAGGAARAPRRGRGPGGGRRPGAARWPRVSSGPRWSCSGWARRCGSPTAARCARCSPPSARRTEPMYRRRPTWRRAQRSTRSPRGLTRPTTTRPVDRGPTRVGDPASGRVEARGRARNLRPAGAHDPAHLRHGGRRLLSRQGPDGFQPRPPAAVPWAAGRDAEARPVPQRRPGHDEPVPARRGLRHRRRGRDRPRHRPLRALPRRAADRQGQRHHRPDLLRR